MSCSPRRQIRLVTVVGELTACLRPVGRTCLRQLDTSNGCQDHTVLPYAATSLVSAPLIAHRLYQPALRSHRAQNAAASTASHPASVTIAIRPSVGRDAKSSRSDLGHVETEIFLQIGLDGKSVICPSGTSSLHLWSYKGRVLVDFARCERPLCGAFRTQARHHAT